MPSHQRRDQIGTAEDIESAGEDRAGNAVRDRGVPCDLGLVDGKVGRVRAELALLDEDLVGIGGCDQGLGCSWSKIMCC